MIDTAEAEGLSKDLGRFVSIEEDPEGRSLGRVPITRPAHRGPA